jgi:hypothetical protein
LVGEEEGFFMGMVRQDTEDEALAEAVHTWGPLTESPSGWSRYVALSYGQIATSNALTDLARQVERDR